MLLSKKMTTSANDFSMPNLTYLSYSLIDMLIFSSILSFLYSKVSLLSTYYMLGMAPDIGDSILK